MHNPEILLQQSENAFADAMKARREGQTMESWLDARCMAYAVQVGHLRQTVRNLCAALNQALAEPSFEPVDRFGSPMQRLDVRVNAVTFPLVVAVDGDAVTVVSVLIGDSWAPVEDAVGDRVLDQLYDAAEKAWAKRQRAEVLADQESLAEARALDRRLEVVL